MQKQCRGNQRQRLNMNFFRKRHHPQLKSRLLTLIKSNLVDLIFYLIQILLQLQAKNFNQNLSACMNDRVILFQTPTRGRCMSVVYTQSNVYIKRQFSAKTAKTPRKQLQEFMMINLKNSGMQEQQLMCNPKVGQNVKRCRSVVPKGERLGFLSEDFFIPGRKFVPGRNWGGRALGVKP